MEYMCSRDSGNLMAIVHQQQQNNENNQMNMNQGWPFNDSSSFAQAQTQTQTQSLHFNDLESGDWFENLDFWYNNEVKVDDHFGEPTGLSRIFLQKNPVSGVPDWVSSPVDSGWLNDVLAEEAHLSHLTNPQEEVFEAVEEEFINVDVLDVAVAKNPKMDTSATLLESLLECAKIADSEPDKAMVGMGKLKVYANETGNVTERVLFYFIEAIYNHIYSKNGLVSLEYSVLASKAMYEVCPYSRFTHLTVNQVILEETESARFIHIVDFGFVEGLQWCALLQDLANKSSGKPERVRITGIASKALEKSSINSVVTTGRSLSGWANSLGLKFEFVPILTPIEELDVSSFGIEQNEVVAVNFMLELHNLLDESYVQVKRVLRLAKSLNPIVVTLAEYEISANGGDYFHRFKNALKYYGTVFESIEPVSKIGSKEFEGDLENRLTMERSILRQRIHNVAGIREGEKWGRMEVKEKWLSLMECSGFRLVLMSHRAISQAKQLISNYYDEYKKYDVMEFESSGFLSVAWNGIPLLTVSAWR